MGRSAEGVSSIDERDEEQSLVPLRGAGDGLRSSLTTHAVTHAVRRSRESLPNTGRFYGPRHGAIAREVEVGEDDWGMDEESPRYLVPPDQYPTYNPMRVSHWQPPAPRSYPRALNPAMQVRVR